MNNITFIFLSLLPQRWVLKSYQKLIPEEKEAAKGGEKELEAII